ncbi:MAG: hypothetical protein JXA92_01140, partial [candidate division Zixibacteria bacterium]|nr:hypothetical protein [candidate division Zixibacteria bacterium]
MALNPFKDSNLKDLQENILDFFKGRFGDFYSSLQNRWQFLRKKGKERITVMFIPHSEKRIVNFHISIFAIFMIVGALIATVTVTSIFIVNHTSTIKEISKLKMFGSNTKIQITKYKEEINRLYDIFQKFKPEITYLYSLMPGNDVDSLWAKGGATNPHFEADGDNAETPPIEVLNIEEMERELKTTKQLLEKIKV